MAIAVIQKKKKKKEDEDEIDLTRWMVTFGDLLSLLLTFFVLMFSMNTLDDQALKDMLSALAGGSGALMFADTFPMEPPRMEKMTNTRTLTVHEFLKYLDKQKRKIEKTVNVNTRGLMQSLLINGVTVKKRGPSFVLSFPNATMFSPGSAKIYTSALPGFKQLAQTLEYSGSTITIEGHTDDTQISTKRFPSNWELSAARAAGVMRYLINSGLIAKERVMAVGYADTRPIVGSISEVYRARNRRIDVVISQTIEDN